jgi:deoxyribodipyrimidine photo-lyase
MNHVPPLRIRSANSRDVRPGASFVLYWMVAARRLNWNFGLDRALEHARALGLPLVILEPLRVGYPWASHRHHAFALQGMEEHAAALQDSPVAYYPYVEPAAGAGKGLLEALAGHAAVVVTDDFPAFFLPRMVEAAAQKVDVRLEAVDSNGLLPLQATPKPFTAAYHFRRFLHKNLRDHVMVRPQAHPLRDVPLETAHIPAEILERWPAADEALLACEPHALAALPVDASVPPAEAQGGSRAARVRLDAFVESGLPAYVEDRNHPDLDVVSGLSTYLHWGHISAHEIFARVAEEEAWTPARLSDIADGRRSGWWGMSEGAEAFVDQLVTWRELGFTYCHHHPDHHRYETLPEWARATLADHESDPRPYVYSLEEFEEARTHDPLWNAAQRQLREEGIIHNYLRMLWGKKILEWTSSPEEALRVMVELNNKYALDGRDPNSYSGIFWCLGRFDRGWPERAVFGKIRCMTSDSTRRKVRLKRYLARWGDGQTSLLP